MIADGMSRPPPRSTRQRPPGAVAPGVARSGDGLSPTGSPSKTNRLAFTRVQVAPNLVARVALREPVENNPADTAATNPPHFRAHLQKTLWVPDERPSVTLNPRRTCP
jgi:hypothetical protein